MGDICFKNEIFLAFEKDKVTGGIKIMLLRLRTTGLHFSRGLSSIFCQSTSSFCKFLFYSLPFCQNKPYPYQPTGGFNLIAAFSLVWRVCQDQALFFVCQVNRVV